MLHSTIETNGCHDVYGHFHRSLNNINMEEFEVNLPNDVFKDVDDEKLKFQISLEDDSEIPEWIEFDPNQLILSGRWKTKEALNLKLTTTDISGNVGEFKFKLEEG